MKLMITDTNGNKMYYGGRRKDGSYKIASSASGALDFGPRAKGNINQVWGNLQKQHPDYKFEYVDWVIIINILTEWYLEPMHK